jgi:hypothetical protein
MTVLTLSLQVLRTLLSVITTTSTEHSICESSPLVLPAISVITQPCVSRSVLATLKPHCLIPPWTVMLARGDAVTYLLRNTKTLEDDEAVRPYIQSGLAVLVKGDATSQSDVQNAWDIASKDGPVDFVVFTIGEWVASSPPTSSDLGLCRSQANQIPSSTRSRASQLTLPTCARSLCSIHSAVSPPPTYDQNWSS